LPGNGSFHDSGLRTVKRINRVISAWQNQFHRSLIRKINFQRHPPSAQRVLLLAPHMDDEMIGCAGLISQYMAMGARIACVYLTDSAFDLTGRERIAHMATRMRETKAAARALGVQQVYFLDQPDGRLEENPALIEKIKGLLEKEAPQVLFLPYPHDPHPDHRVLWLLAVKALDGSRAEGTAVYFYQILVPIPLEEIALAIDISCFFEAKRSLLAGYSSQLRLPLDLALHLQGCQGALFGRDCRAVEVYAAATPERLDALTGNGGEPRRQVSRHLHVGWYALRRRSGKNRQNARRRPGSREEIPCS